jgi:molybdopterin-guanine dinucleotide biosynthesis protein A
LLPKPTLDLAADAGAVTGAFGGGDRHKKRIGVSKVSESIAGVLLAGGQARRMGGGDKCLMPLAGRPLLQHAIERAQPQVSALLLNANGDPARFRGFGLPVVADVAYGGAVENFAGPLAGILTGLEWFAENLTDTVWMASFATDAPLIPDDLVSRLAAAVEAESADMACARSAGRAHPVFALWPLRLGDELRRAVVEEGLRKIDAWTARYRLVQVDFACHPRDPFFNINNPESLAEAERLLGQE